MTTTMPWVPTKKPTDRHICLYVYAFFFIILTDEDHNTCKFKRDSDLYRYLTSHACVQTFKGLQQFAFNTKSSSGL